MAVVAISSNDVENYPDDSPEKMKQEGADRGYTFPYLYDETQEVARAYRAACTPDFYLFDADRRLVYRGQFDAARAFIDEALDAAPRNPLQSLAWRSNLRNLREYVDELERYSQRELQPDPSMENDDS